MEVTRSNFLSVKKDMLEAISTATFVSFDGEFTGLSTGSHNISPLDSPKMRYFKLKSNHSVDFLLLQVGICTFHHDIASNSFEARPFNVFLFPRSPVGLRGVSSPLSIFKCQSSSIEFLAAQDFDFNKAFKDGVGYLPLHVHQKLKDDLLQKEKEQLLLEVSQKERKESQGTPSKIHKSEPQQQQQQQQQGQNGHTQIDVPPEQKPYMDDVVKKIDEFLNDGSKSSLDLPPSNAYQRKLVFQTVQSKYAAVLEAESRLGTKHERFVSLVKADEDQKKKLAEEKALEKWRQLDEALGFTAVIKALADSQKIIIGHNMLLDVLHLLHSFVIPDLPDDYEDFKSLANGMFPNVVDTKVMATNLPFKELIPDHSLGPLRDRLEQSPFKPLSITLAKGYERYQRQLPSQPKSSGGGGGGEGSAEASNDGPLHEAGYDAFITGICFASMVNYLASFLDPPVVSISPSSQLVSPYLNKVHLMRSSPDLPYVTLDGPDLNPSRDHVFHLTFPSDWRNLEIFQLFKQFGQIIISWIDDTHAFVTLKDKDFVSPVTKFICSSSSSTTPSPSVTYRLVPFDAYLSSFWPNVDSKNAPATTCASSSASAASTSTTSLAATSGATNSADKATSPGVGVKRTAAQAGLEKESSPHLRQPSSQSSREADSQSSVGIPPSLGKRAKKVSVTSLAASALLGRGRDRVGRSAVSPPSILSAVSESESPLSPSSRSASSSLPPSENRYSWTKNPISKAKAFLSRALSGPSSTEDLIPPSGSSESVFSVPPRKPELKRKTSAAKGKIAEEVEEGELADSSSSNEDELASKKLISSTRRVVVSRSGEATIMKTSANNRRIVIASGIDEEFDSDDVKSNDEDTICSKTDLAGKDDESGNAEDKLTVDVGKKRSPKGELVEDDDEGKGGRKRLRRGAHVEKVSPADESRESRESRDEETSDLTETGKAVTEQSALGTDSDSSHQPPPPGVDASDEEAKKKDEEAKKKDEEAKKKKGGKAAKNSFKRLSARRKDEKDKAYEAKVKLFEEDEEWG